jgi:uncharacterized protein
MITPELIATIKEQFRINWAGNHGISHWARVYDIGMKLTKQTGANQNVVQLFSVFHDSRRYSEHLDPNHGPRGAELATQLQKAHFPLLTDEEFALLHMACCLHTKASTHENITVQTCFDADRLDLGRVGKVPKPEYLCTDAAKSEEMIAWAYKRSVRGAVPDNVLGRSILQVG